MPRSHALSHVCPSLGHNSPYAGKSVTTARAAVSRADLRGEDLDLQATTEADLGLSQGHMGHCWTALQGQAGP